MKSALFLLWAKLRAVLRRIVLSALHANDPWERDRFVDLSSPTLKLLIEQAEANEENERGTMICWSYFRDRVAEQRELRTEPEFQKRKRLIRARLDKLQARKASMRLIC